MLRPLPTTHTSTGTDDDSSSERPWPDCPNPPTNRPAQHYHEPRLLRLTVSQALGGSMQHTSTNGPGMLVLLIVGGVLFIAFSIWWFSGRGAPQGSEGCGCMAIFIGIALLIGAIAYGVNYMGK